MKKISELIRIGRAKKGLKQSEVAQRIGTSPNSISLWEKGDSVPAGDKLVKLAKELDFVQNLFPEYDIEKKSHVPKSIKWKSKEYNLIAEIERDLSKEENNNSIEILQKAGVNVKPDSVSLSDRGMVVKCEQGEFLVTIVTNKAYIYSYEAEEIDYKKAHSNLEKKVDKLAEKMDKIADALLTNQGKKK